MKINVVLADDHALVRAGLRMLVEAMPDVVVLGEASDGYEAIALVEKHHPHMVLMDIAMPGLNGLEATQRISKQWPDVKVVMLSMHQDDQYVRQALKMGASGYLLKDSATTELALAVRAVLRGETYLSPAASKGVLSDYVQRLRSDSSADVHLTPRQREVLQLIAEGCSTKEVAQRLGLAVKTVETHRTLLMKQLDVHEVAGLVRYAVRAGIVSPTA
jgi:DNA-binding NarL/FixJ family response regulator